MVFALGFLVFYGFAEVLGRLPPKAFRLFCTKWRDSGAKQAMV